MVEGGGVLFKSWNEKKNGFCLWKGGGGGGVIQYPRLKKKKGWKIDSGGGGGVFKNCKINRKNS